MKKKLSFQSQRIKTDWIPNDFVGILLSDINAYFVTRQFLLEIRAGLTRNRLFTQNSKFWSRALKSSVGETSEQLYKVFTLEVCWSLSVTVNEARDFISDLKYTKPRNSWRNNLFVSTRRLTVTLLHQTRPGLARPQWRRTSRINDEAFGRAKSVVAIGRRHFDFQRTTFVTGTGFGGDNA